MTTLVSVCQRARLPMVDKKERLKLSQSNDIESLTKGADDHIGLYVSTGSLSSG